MRPRYVFKGGGEYRCDWRGPNDDINRIWKHPFSLHDLNGEEVGNRATWGHVGQEVLGPTDGLHWPITVGNEMLLKGFHRFSLMGAPFYAASVLSRGLRCFGRSSIRSFIHWRARHFTPPAHFAAGSPAPGATACNWNMNEYEMLLKEAY